ncbi:MAG: ferredoxin family protein [Candidatus Poribacteria bacterium]
MAYVISEPCVDVKDTACVAVCPVDCIYEFDGENMLYIHPEECIDCDACVPECPVEAIFPEAEVPAQWQSYIAMNVEAFERHSVEAAAGDDDAAPAPAAGPVASSAETAAVKQVLADVAAKNVTPEEALDQVIPLLEQCGVTVTEG